MTKKYKCRVEYLESTGTQYIDSGVYPTQLTEVEYRCAVTGSVANNDSHLFGSRLSASSKAFDLAYMNTSANGIEKFRFIHGTTTTQETTTSVTASQLANPHTYYMSGTSFKVDGSEKMSFTTASFTGSYSLWLFGVNSAGSLHNQVRAQRVYKCIIWNNGTLVRDMIPVLDNSGRPAMYDQVSEKLFYNQGTGEFTYGRQIIPVEYLESTGTQYIDTGVKGKNNIDFDYKAVFTNVTTSSGYGIGGEWQNSNSLYLGLIRSNGTFAYHYGNTSSPVVVLESVSADTPYSIQGHMWTGEQYMVINGTKSSVGTIAGTFTATENIALFRVTSSNPIYSYAKIYYLKIWDNGVIVRDLIPCIDENLTPFMFDLVTNTCYLNEGTGQFKVGPNVEKAWGGKKLRRKLALALANLKKKRKYYCEVEYLESTGTQWIDTEYVMTSGHSSTFNGNIMWTQNAATANFFYGYRSVNAATYEGDMRAFFIYGASPAGRLAIRYGVNTDNSTSVAVSLNQKYNISWDGDNLKVNGTTYATLTQAYTPANYKNMWLFWCNCAGYYSTDVGHFVGRIYNWQIFDNGILVRDMIPVLDWDMKPCMYDRVTEQLFYNAGTGSFVAGREIHPVEYLESDSTAYIDTGVSGGNDNLKIEMGFSYSKFTAYGYFFSNYESETANVTRFCLNGTDTDWGLAYINTKSQDGAIYTKIFTKNDFHSFVLTKTSIIIDGNEATKSNPPVGTANTKNIILFNRGSGSYYEKRDIGMSCYYFRIYDNDILVRDFIPAISEDGTAFMFDRVTHTIYLNQGTGQFSYPAREVEYLQSDGARAILAGVTVDDTCGYDVKWMALNADDRIILGTKGSGDSRWVLSGNNNPNINLSWNTMYGSNGLGLNKIQTAQMNYLNDRKRILNDTPLEDITTTLSANASTYNVGIFAGYWGATTISLYSTCRIYYAKITKGTELIRDFIPMVKDGSPCLYDKVGGEYYFGIGTGSFSKGKIVEPEYE